MIETVLFEPLCVKIGQPVRPVDDLEKLKKERKTNKSCNFTIVGGEIPGTIVIHFVSS